MEIQDILYVQIVFIILTFIVLFRLIKTDSRVEKKLGEINNKIKKGKDKE